MLKERSAVPFIKIGLVNVYPQYMIFIISNGSIILQLTLTLVRNSQYPNIKKNKSQFPITEIGIPMPTPSAVIMFMIRPQKNIVISKPFNCAIVKFVSIF